MLEMEAGKDRQYFYHKKLMDDVSARQYLDIWAVHGYVNGVAPTATSQMAQLWKTTKAEYTDPSSKPIWMTETSGYFDTWNGTAQQPGAMDLALSIHAALYHGKASAWVWWQGSDNGTLNEFNLMQGTTKKGKRYYASKHFYRFIRPGAQMVDVSFNENEGVFASAFENQAMGAFTLVLINTNTKEVKVNLTGTNVPDAFDFYQTTSKDDCVKKETVANNAVTLPPQSVVTLVNGNVFE
jgi:O-glycosyl hydrolase